MFQWESLFVVRVEDSVEKIQTTEVRLVCFSFRLWTVFKDPMGELCECIRIFRILFLCPISNENPYYIFNAYAFLHISAFFFSLQYNCTNCLFFI